MQAWEDGGILHRDVSVGNMLIVERDGMTTPEGNEDVIAEGMLTDWELSKPKSSLQQRQPHRTVSHSHNLKFD